MRETHTRPQRLLNHTYAVVWVIGLALRHVVVVVVGRQQKINKNALGMRLQKTIKSPTLRKSLLNTDWKVLRIPP